MFRRIIPFTILAVCLAAVAALETGCNERETKTYPIWLPDAAPPAKTYSTTPESTSELLKDSSDAIKATYPPTEGVHFTLESQTTGGGKTMSWRAEGDMIFPDRVKMTTRSLLTADPVTEEVIDTGGQAYVRSGADGAWHSGNPQLPAPDPQIIANYLDFARGSRNFGQESLAGGQKTWHVQVDVDMGMLAFEAMNHTTDQSEAQRLDSMKSDSVTVDFWIGNDDRLPYQMVVKTTDPARGQSEQQTFIFSRWKEHPAIARPCIDC
ncbi:MAG: LolA-like protein [Thermoleophilia bacterium]